MSSEPRRNRKPAQVEAAVLTPTRFLGGRRAPGCKDLNLTMI